ncbi:MAG: hypothetical protein KAQ94_00090 [Arcobacteraceae bacterium]|nr:hypothetical protein [Arcobacteraceae bacterium]
MYLSLRKICSKYDIHKDTLKKFNMVEGIHFVRINKMIRYHEQKMHKLLTSNTKPSKSISDEILDRLLI